MRMILLTFLALIGFSGAAHAQAGGDPANPAHCESALKMAVIIAENFEPARAPALKRQAEIAAAEAARLDSAVAVAGRKQVWPVLADREKLTALVGACIARQSGQPAAARAAAPPFETAVYLYSACMRGATQLGMRLRLDPARFRAELPQKCQREEAQFREAGVREAMRQGRSEAQARAEIDGNVAKARAAYAADQASYVATGKVPR